MAKPPVRDPSFLIHVIGWFDSWSGAHVETTGSPRVHWARAAPFILLHLGCFGVLWWGWSPVAVAAAVVLYLMRAFFVTGFYHRYFSHKTYKTTRVGQFIFGVLGNSAVQRGPLWWAAHHRRHHQVSDREGDPHSPHVQGFIWSHLGWLTAQENFPTEVSRVPDLARYPELCWLDRFDTVVPLAMATGLFGLGHALAVWYPSLGTSGMQMLVWGFFVSTVVVLHVTCLVNSATHSFGRRPYATTDRSRNSLIIALLTLGEGWHNNHHRYPSATRQGFTFWEIDVTYYVLKVFSWLGLIWDMRPVPARVMAQRGRAGEA